MMKYALDQDHYPIKMITVGAGGRFVHNVLDTKDEPVPDGYGTLLKYWSSKTSRPIPDKCLALDPHVNQDSREADQYDIVGAHVRIDGENCPDDWAWVVPLCKHCNNDGRTWSIYLPAGTKLVPVKMQKVHYTATHTMDDIIQQLIVWKVRGKGK